MECQDESLSPKPTVGNKNSRELHFPPSDRLHGVIFGCPLGLSRLVKVIFVIFGLDHQKNWKEKEESRLAVHLSVPIVCVTTRFSAPSLL